MRPLQVRGFMHRSEARELVDCIECHATIAAERDRAFAVTEDEWLCFECATRRGGVWDDEEDEWTTTPDLTGLYDERRPHA